MQLDMFSEHEIGLFLFAMTLL